MSPGFARESLTPAFGMGLDEALRAKGDRFLGILNGIDTDLWNPATDAALAVPYDLGSLGRKATCRRDLLERNGMDPEDDGLVVGMIGRLDPQKGFDLARRRRRRACSRTGPGSSCRGAATRRSPTRSGRSPRRTRAAWR